MRVLSLNQGGIFMKKFISVLLTVVILVSTLLGINAFAEGSRSEDFLKKLNETKSVGMSVPDGELDFGKIKITDVKLAAKIFTDKNGKNELKIAGTGTVFGVNARLIMDKKDIWIYIPSWKVKMRITDFLDYDGSASDYGELLFAVIEVLGNDIMPCMKLASVEDKEVEPYGQVSVEHFEPDVAATAKKAVEKGIITLPEGMNPEDITKEELLKYAELAGDNGDGVAAMLDSYVDFYYRGESLVGFKMYAADLEDASQTISSADMLPFNVSEITADISDDMFDVSGFYFNLTFLAPLIIAILGTMI